MVYQIEKILTLESLKCQMWFFSTFCWVLPEYMRLVIIILPSLFCHQPPPTPTPQAYFPGFLLSFTVHTPSLPNKAINTTSANLVDTTKTIHLGLLIKKKTQRNRIFDWNTCGGRGSLLLSHACLWVALVNIKKENCTDWKSQIYLRAALGVILVAGSHSRHRRMKSVNRGSSQPDICILWQLIVDLCLALEGKDDELFPPLRAVCSSLDPGGPLGLPRRDLMEYTELRKQYWTIQRKRQKPSIVRMVD